jgi:hypothetical protein
MAASEGRVVPLATPVAEKNPSSGSWKQAHSSSSEKRWSRRRTTTFIYVTGAGESPTGHIGDFDAADVQEAY